MAQSEDQIELDILTRKPLCFVIFGKAGSGKTTLARQLSTVWKCHLIDGASTIEEAIQGKTPLGEKAEQRLKNGEELSADLVAQVITEKLNSTDVTHYGYILDCLPSAIEEWQSIDKQLEFIRELKLNPDIIINLKIPDQDLEARRTEQRVDPINNKLFVRAVYDPESKESARILEEEEEGSVEADDERSQNENKEDNNEGEDFFEDDLGAVEGLLDSVVDPVRLVQRKEDLQFCMQKQVQHYNEKMLTKLEDFIISHNQQHVIELDANLPPKELFKSLLVRLRFLGLSRCPVPLRLVDPEEGDEEPEGIDDEQFLQQLSETNNLLPKFRWRRSRWGRLCPVELAQGNMVPGRMEFAVGFLDKMYSMSSAKALGQFIHNPRHYLLPPNPINPCKVCIVGPPLSGKSTLAKKIAEKYNAVVLVIADLLEPVLKRARELSVEEAKLEAKNTAINTISAQLAAQQAHQGNQGEVPEVTADHPDVVKAVNAAIEKAHTAPLEYTQEMYMEALKTGVQEAGKRRTDIDPDGPRFGGWVVDGFPETRENWAAMIESNLLPDSVLSIEDDLAPTDFLLARFAAMNGLPDPSILKVSATQQQQEGEAAPVPPPSNIVQWQKKRSDFDRLWGQLSASVKGSAIDPVHIDCSLSEDKVTASAIKLIEDVFSYKALEYSALEDDADADDDPILDQGEGDEDGEENEEQALKRKPWGDSGHFCPVALVDKGVLWPGSQDTSARYRERLYFFSSEEAKEQFISDPQTYTSQAKSLKPPPLRIFLIGVCASGKTTLGREAAKQLGIFHISFPEYLQEEILPKMRKPPLVDEDDWEKEQEEREEQKEDEEGDDDLDDDVRVQLTVEETEIKGHLIHGDPLSEEIIEKFSTKFWHTEPFRSSGFVLEGLPSSADDLRFLASRGLFADSAVVLQVGEKEVVTRLLPGKMEIWQRKKQKRLEKKAQDKEAKMKQWEADKAQRKVQLKTEYDEKFATKMASKIKDEEDDEDADQFTDEDLEEYEEQVAEINQEEFPDDEDEEEEEEETDAKERLRTAVTEKYEEQAESISNIQDVLLELQIPVHTVNAGRTISVVQYSFFKAIHPYTVDRQGLLSKCTRIDGDMAKKLLNHGYKQLSKFKTWCPVEDSGGVLPPKQPLKTQMFPVIYHQDVYFISSSTRREKFVANPEMFLTRPAPESPVPVRLAVVGPPKSGKSSVALRLASEYGCMRLSIGEAVRLVIEKFPNSKLTDLILSHLKIGQTVPEDLCVHALERALLDVQCMTRGYVLDGWPMTKGHVDLLTKFRIIPVCVVELEITEGDMLKRNGIDRLSPTRTQPLHDSTSILAIRSSHYNKNINDVRKWYKKEHDNWQVVDGSHSLWWVWNEVNGYALKCTQQIQHYLHRISSNQAASIAGLCITPKEFESDLGEYGQYCPVSLALQNELADCSTFHSLACAAEYRHKYYKMSSQDNLDAFLSSPESFVSPKASRCLPLPELLPQRRTHADVKSRFPKQLEIQGICPVSFVDGQQRYESVALGNPEIVAEYKAKLYCFVSEEKREKFMRQPQEYEVTSLPTKLPPLKQPLPMTSLPMLGYLEQTVATAVIGALSAVGATKPKFPFLTSTNSAIFYVACQLKAINPKSKDYMRKRFQNKLVQFEQHCQLIAYLSSEMKPGYKEPVNRPLGFDYKMGSFLGLQNTSSGIPK